MKKKLIVLLLSLTISTTTLTGCNVAAYMDGGDANFSRVDNSYVSLKEISDEDGCVIAYDKKHKSNIYVCIWIKWLSKDEIRIFEHEQEIKTKETTTTLSSELSKEVKMIYDFCEQRKNGLDRNAEMAGDNLEIAMMFINQSTCYWAVQQFIEVNFIEKN